MWQITENIIARQFDLSDAKCVLKSVNDNRQYLRQWLPWLDSNTTEADFSKFINDCIIGSQTGQSLVLGLWDKSTSQHIGNFGFNFIRDGVGEIGYWLAKDHQHQGIMHHACRWLIEYGFYELGLHKIIIRIAAKNVKSKRIAERLGFSFGELMPQAAKLYDKLVEQVEYYLTAADFSPQPIDSIVPWDEQLDYLKQRVIPTYQTAISADIYQTI